MMEKYSDLLTLSEFAEIVRCSKNTCYGWIKSGKVRSVRIGKEHRIEKRELMKILENNRPSENK